MNHNLCALTINIYCTVSGVGQFWRSEQLRIMPVVIAIMAEMVSAEKMDSFSEEFEKSK